MILDSDDRGVVSYGSNWTILIDTNPLQVTLAPIIDPNGVPRSLSDEHTEKAIHSRGYDQCVRTEVAHIRTRAHRAIPGGAARRNNWSRSRLMLVTAQSGSWVKGWRT